MRLDAVSDLLATQRGVVSRRQLLTAGVTQTGIDTLLRRRDLVLLHPGTYLTHTGRPTWEERSWAAVLHSGRSALHLGSALHRPGKDPPPPGPIHVAIDWSRRVAPVNGVQVHRVRGLDGLVQWHVSPPRVRLEVAAVEVAHRRPTTWRRSPRSPRWWVPGVRSRPGSGWRSSGAGGCGVGTC